MNALKILILLAFRGVLIGIDRKIIVFYYVENEVINMGASKHIKTAMLDKGIKPGAVAVALGYDDKQVFYNKISRDTMKFSDVEKIADALGCDVVLIDRETKKTY